MLRRLNLLKMPAKTRGFTLLELIVVIAIILVLTMLVFGVMKHVREKQRVVQAIQRVRDIAAAASLYQQEFGQYPPDTGDYGGDEAIPNQEYAIHRFLGSRLMDKKTGKVVPPFMTMNQSELKGEDKDIDGQTCKLFTDPWGQPYKMDCMHPKMDIKTGEVTPDGWPSMDPANPEPEDPEVKVWSDGPDKKSTDGAQKDKVPAEDDLDNVNSWSAANNQKKE